MPLKYNALPTVKENEKALVKRKKIKGWINEIEYIN